MKKIKMLVNSIVNGSIGTQITAGVVAVSLIGGAAFGGYKAVQSFNESKQASSYSNVESLKNKIDELITKINELPVNEEVEKLKEEVKELSIINLAENYDEAYDKYKSLEKKYEEVYKSIVQEAEALLKELEGLDVSTLNDEQKSILENSISNYKVICGNSNYKGYKSAYEEAKRVYEGLINGDSIESITEEVKDSNEESKKEESVEVKEESKANGSSNSTPSNSSSNNSSASNSSSNNSQPSSTPSNGSSNSGQTKPSNSGQSNSNSSTNNGSTNAGQTKPSNSGSNNTGSSSSSTPSAPAPSNPAPSNPTPSAPAPSKPQYEAFNGFNYNGSYASGYVGGYNNFASEFYQLSSKSTVSSFNSYVNTAVGALAQGASESVVKSQFLNKVYSNKYLITDVNIERFKVPNMINGEVIFDQFSEAIKQGALNTPGGLFSSVIGDYALVSDDDNIHYVKVTVKFKEI